MITITLDRYVHLMPGSEVEARTPLDSYLVNRTCKDDLAMAFAED